MAASKSLLLPRYVGTFGLFKAHTSDNTVLPSLSFSSSHLLELAARSQRISEALGNYRCPTFLSVKEIKKLPFTLYILLPLMSVMPVYQLYVQRESVIKTDESCSYFWCNERLFLKSAGKMPHMLTTA